MIIKRKSQRGSRDGEEWSGLELAEVKVAPRVGRVRRKRGRGSQRRIKIEDRRCCYHVMSRTVNGEVMLQDVEKESFRRMMWRMARFCGVDIITYAVMGNHFHVLASIPLRSQWLKRFDGETSRDRERKILDHLSILYSKSYLERLEQELDHYRKLGDQTSIEEILSRFTDRMCDVSRFVKELKERFARWFNQHHDRFGPLWNERFKSVIVEDEKALFTIAAYIDLNPVRAGLVDDPSAYRWSGYGEAVEGSSRAIEGLCRVFEVPASSWEREVQAIYRLLLYGEALPADEQMTALRAQQSLATRKKYRSDVSAELDQEVAEAHGYLLVHHLLRKRLTVLSTGVAFGESDKVYEIARLRKKLFKLQWVRKPKILSGAPDDFRLFSS